MKRLTTIALEAATILAALVPITQADATVLVVSRDKFFCSNGQEYAVFFDGTGGPNGKGSLFPAARTFDSFCAYSLSNNDEKIAGPNEFLSVPRACAADESKPTMACFEEFKALGNLASDGALKENLIHGKIADATNYIEVNKSESSKEAIDNLKPYPRPSPAQKRVTIFLKPQVEQTEGNLQVEILIGKIEEVDSCNSHFLTGAKLTEKTVQGWGYTFLEAELGNGVAATRMFCGGSNTRQFVPGARKMIRYNSRLPVVVLGEAEMIVHYRIWSAQNFIEAK